MQKNKVSKLNTRNINKRLRSTDQKIKVLEERISWKDKELEELKKKNEVFSEIIKQKTAKEAAYRSKVWYWKRIAKKTTHFGSDHENTIKKLNDEIRSFKKGNLFLKDGAIAPMVTQSTRRVTRGGEGGEFYPALFQNF